MKKFRAIPADFAFRILAELPGKVAVYDSNLRFIFVNEAAVTNPELREWIIGKNDIEYCEYTNQDIAIGRTVMERLQRVLTTGIAEEYEERLSNEEGQVNISCRKITATRDAKGKIIYLTLSGMEIPSQQHLQEGDNAYYEKIHKQVTEELRYKEQRLILVSKLARTGSFEYNIDTMQVEWSPGTFEIFEKEIGTGPPSIPEYLDHVFPDDRHLVENLLNDIPISSGHVTAEFRIITYTGKIKYVKNIAQPEYASDGTIARIIGSVNDITEQKNTERELRIHRQHLEEAQDLARLGSWEYDLLNRHLTWSTGMYDLWKRKKNLPPPRLKEFLETVHPDDRDPIRKMFTVIYATGANQEIEFRIRTVNNEWLHTYSRVFARTKADGQITSLHGTIIDISERKRNEELLRENQRSLVEAQEMARSGNFTIDLVKINNMWSPGMFKLIGWDKPVPPPLDEFFSWVDPQDRQRLLDFHTGIVYLVDSDEIEYALNLPNGNRIIVLARAKAIKDATGKAIKITGTVTDITQQAEAREILRHMKDQSEEMIRAKEYFLANISHELKTPLNGILGMARLLQKTDLNATQRKYTDVLNSTAGNLLVIINDILDVAKIESGTLSLERIPFDPLQVADTALQVQLYKAEEKDLVLRHIQTGTPLPVVIGDPYRLNQILLNLLSNAIKFTPSGEVVLTHRIQEEDDHKVVIEFSVTDTGIGIHPERIENIFESFMQVHDVKHEHYGGTGLGLTISRNLVEMQGGSIHVESTSGKGSRFYFSIPYQKASKKENASTEQQRIDLKKLGALRILVAEDNRVNQFITEAMLLDWGFKVDVADNGIEAFEKIKKSDYDLVLMDIQMPGMSGIEATKAIRALSDSRKSKIPIIALTANTTKNAQRKFIAEGMNDCLVKPFKEETLFRRIILQLEGDEKFNMVYKRPRYPVRKRPVPSGEQLYNLDMLRKDARNNPQFFRRMLQIFMDTIPPIIERMSEHFEKGEMDAVSTLAHKIKPTIDGTGISSLHDTIRNMENYRDKKRSREQLAADLQRLKEVIGAVTAAFHSELAALSEKP